ncbi:uncharacterized protein METZ01_LOCUS373969, partial [marine metagenome]
NILLFPLSSTVTHLAVYKASKFKFTYASRRAKQLDFGVLKRVRQTSLISPSPHAAKQAPRIQRLKR